MNWYDKNNVNAVADSESEIVIFTSWRRISKHVTIHEVIMNIIIEEKMGGTKNEKIYYFDVIATHADIHYIGWMR